jgi:hypothetical protein
VVGDGRDVDADVVAGDDPLRLDRQTVRHLTVPRSITRQSRVRVRTGRCRVELAQAVQLR